jgi:hypothetical protein
MEAASSQSVANDTRDLFFFQFCDIKKIDQKKFPIFFANLIKVMHFSKNYPIFFDAKKKSWIAI